MLTLSVWSLVAELEEPWVDGLAGLVHDLDQIVCLWRIILREESVGGAGCVGSAGSSNAMHIILRIIWVIIIDDKLDIDVCEFVQITDSLIENENVSLDFPDFQFHFIF
jgi:hypothetical protein